MSRNGLRVLVAVACAGLGAGFTSGAAQAKAGQDKAETNVTISHSCPGFPGCRAPARLGFNINFSGDVKSKADECEAIRKVKLVETTSKEKVGKTTSDVDGSWEIEYQAGSDGKYVAKVGKETKQGTKCSAAKSKKDEVDASGRRRAQSAARHDKDFETTLTIKDKGTKFTGRVKSDSDDCIKRRQVIVYRQEGSDPPFEIGRDRSDKKGKWKVNQLIGDGYYAEVEEKVVERGDHTHTCLFDRSPTTPFPPMRAGGETAKTKLRMKMQCDDGTCEKAKALTSGSFTGKVRSSASDCVDGRTIKVIRKGVSPGPIDSVDAAANGKWTIESDDLLPGTYLAKAGKTTEGGTKCKPAKSKKWTLEFNRR